MYGHNTHKQIYKLKCMLWDTIYSLKVSCLFRCKTLCHYPRLLELEKKEYKRTTTKVGRKGTLFTWLAAKKRFEEGLPGQAGLLTWLATNEKVEEGLPGQVGWFIVVDYQCESYRGALGTSISYTLLTISERDEEELPGQVVCLLGWKGWRGTLWAWWSVICG